MPKAPTLRFDHSANEAIIKKFFSATSPRFDAAMGQRLAKAREKMGLTQRQLAERLGLSQVHISRLERGKNIAAMPKCDAFKTVLGKHFEHVLIEDGYYKEEDLTIGYNKQIRKFVGSKRNSNNVS